jgi:hypothetical protein
MTVFGADLPGTTTTIVSLPGPSDITTTTIVRLPGGDMIPPPGGPTVLPNGQTALPGPPMTMTTAVNTIDTMSPGYYNTTTVTSSSVSSYSIRGIASPLLFISLFFI